MQANALRDGILTHHSSYQLIISSSIDIPSGSINTFIVKWHEDAKIYKLEYYCTRKNPHVGIPLRMRGHTWPYIIILVPFKERHTINCTVILPLIMKHGEAHITCVDFAPIRRLRIKTTSQWSTGNHFTILPHHQLPYAPTMPLRYSHHMLAN